VKFTKPDVLLKLENHEFKGEIQKVNAEIELKLKSGRIISLPKNFEVLTIRNSKIITEKVETLKKDNLIAVPRRLPNNNNHQKLDNTTPLNTRLNIVPKLPAILNEDLAYFLGLMSSDGYITRHQRVLLTNTNEKLVKIFKEKVKSLFNLIVGDVNVKEKRGNKTYEWGNYVVYSKAVKDFLILNFDLREGRKNEYIRVPSVLKDSPKQVIAKYLRGLFDGDGSMVIGKRNIALRLTAKNREFAFDTQELLLFFGIRSYVKKNKKRELWGVDIGNRINIEKFRRKIGFNHSKKLKRIIKATRKKRCEFVKIGNTIKEERSKRSISQKKLAKKLGIGATTLAHYEKDDSLPKSRILQKMAKIFKSEKLMKIVNSKNYKNSIRERHKLSGFKKTTNDDVFPKKLARKCILGIKEKYKVSQDEIARAIGTSQGRIGNYERGATKISYEVLKKLNENFPTKFTSLLVNSDIFWDKIIKVNDVSSEARWPNIKEFIYFNRIIARCNDGSENKIIKEESTGICG